MKPILPIAVLTLTAAGWLVPDGHAQRHVRVQTTTESRLHSGAPEWFEHLSIGIRAAYRTLDDDSRKPIDVNENGDISADEVLAVSYMGSITELNVDQVYWPTLPYLQWAFTPCWGLELGWEHYGVDTKTWWDGHTDGTFVLSGPALSVYGRWPNATRVTPFAQLGLLWLDIDFDPDLRWHVLMDENSFDAWIDAGMPDDWNDGHRQHLDPESDLGALFMVGCDVQLTPQVYLDLFLRFIYVEAYAHWYNTRLFYDDDHPNGERRDSSDQGWFDFPLESLDVGVGARYEF